MTASFTLPTSSDYSFAACCHFLDRGYDECLYTVQEGCVKRLICIEEQIYLLGISAQPAGLQVTMQSELLHDRHQQAALAYVADWLDTSTDLSPFYAILEQTPWLAPLAKAYKGLPVVGIPDLFEAICWSIIGQQINLSFAYQLKRRLVTHYGRSKEVGGQRYWLFPEPAVLAGAEDELLRTMKFSRSKIKYLKGIAAACRAGTLSKQHLLSLPAFAERQNHLMRHKGIGVWSANYVLMKCLRDVEAVPYGDAGLHQALIKLGYIKDKTEQEKISALFVGFAGWESYLVMYLWRSLSAAKS